MRKAIKMRKLEVPFEADVVAFVGVGDLQVVVLNEVVFSEVVSGVVEEVIVEGKCLLSRSAVCAASF